MARRKKRAWNMSNPLYRYLHKRKSKSSRTAKASSAAVSKMAKRKFRRSSSASTGSLLTVVGSAMLYGAVRAKLSQVTQQYLPSFAGQYTDEVVLGVAGWYLSKKGGMIGQLGKAALIIESASVGNQLAAGMMNSTVSTNSYAQLGY